MRTSRFITAPFGRDVGWFKALEDGLVYLAKPATWLQSRILWTEGVNCIKRVAINQRFFVLFTAQEVDFVGCGVWLMPQGGAQFQERFDVFFANFLCSALASYQSLGK